MLFFLLFSWWLSWFLLVQVLIFRTVLIIIVKSRLRIRVVCHGHSDGDRDPRATWGRHYQAVWVWVTLARTLVTRESGTPGARPARAQASLSPWSIHSGHWWPAVPRLLVVHVPRTGCDAGGATGCGPARAAAAAVAGRGAWASEYHMSARSAMPRGLSWLIAKSQWLLQHHRDQDSTGRAWRRL
jgi:hypothetical protein